ncbi:Rho guanine nucleotide exchange factor 39 [Mizuhopecten yessoensis]|uniref:Rho guanine nucleotide exchange factor 39 n=1 Tax=Mizuhopecten yessoensis TaxID=6573 RepID=A0A210QWC0_MIZYE|nr:Rho guanine nucleotide exchange factor 39 [Mizuhopecten yessoensis]
MLSTRSRFKVLNEIAEEENASFNSGNGDTDRLQQAAAKRERRRQKITIELFESEKTYLSHLDLVNKHFDFPLRFNCLIPENVHTKIFSNTEQIMEVNKTLLEYMEEMTVGEAFRYLGPFLKLYSSYANNHGTALSTLQEWMQKSPEFAQFIHTQEEKPEVKGLKINALLITPVQRVPRYKLLLEDLMEHTSPDHHDYPHLQEATKQVTDIAAHINDHMKQHDNFQKMLSIQKSFDSSAPKILAPGREFIKEGPLKKVSRRGGKPLDRMFFLFSDMLIYGKPKFLDSGNKSYSCCCVLPLKHCEVERVFGAVKKTGDAGGMFKVSCKDENLLLYTHNQEEVKSWITALETHIRRLSSNRSTLRKPSSTKAPMRGKSLFKHRKKEQKIDDQQKAKIQHKENKPKTIRFSGSPLKTGLSPLRNQIRALSDLDLNLSNCRSPSKKRRLDASQISTPVAVSMTRNGKPYRPHSLDLSDVKFEDAGSPDLDLFPTSVDMDNCDGIEECEDIEEEEEEEEEDGGVDDTANHTEENTFMQMTMDDLGAADVDLDSFCNPARRRGSDSTSTIPQDVYYPNSYHGSSEQSHSRHSLQSAGDTFGDHHVSVIISVVSTNGFRVITLEGMF